MDLNGKFSVHQWSSNLTQVFVLYYIFWKDFTGKQCVIRAKTTDSYNKLIIALSCNNIYLFNSRYMIDLLSKLFDYSIIWYGQIVDTHPVMSDTLTDICKRGGSYSTQSHSFLSEYQLYFYRQIPYILTNRESLHIRLRLRQD